MPTRKLTDEERARAQSLLEEVRASLKTLSGEDAELLFAYRRKVAKELSYDERSKPAKRKSLKQKKLISQNGKCDRCGETLRPAGRDSVLDRLNAMDGYSEANTRLLCQSCDRETQSARAFTG